MFFLPDNLKKVYKRLAAQRGMFAMRSMSNFEYGLTLIFVLGGLLPALGFFWKDPLIQKICLIDVLFLAALLVEFIFFKKRRQHVSMGRYLGWFVYPMQLAASGLILHLYRPELLVPIQTIWVMMLVFYNSFRIHSQILSVLLMVFALMDVVYALVVPAILLNKFIYLFISVSVLIVAEIQRRITRDIVLENQNRLERVSVEFISEIESTQREIIFKFSEIAEGRSRETGHHVRRVAEYSRVLGLASGLDDRAAGLLVAVSPMHDIGKLGVPDSILTKDGPLTGEERKIMERHAVIGYDMLKNSPREVFTAAAIVAHQHHEKYMGGGYPLGHKGADIHIYGRISALADVFDALASDRCYKKAWPMEKIADLLKAERGRHFDPILVDVFFQQLKPILKIHDQWKDAV